MMPPAIPNFMHNSQERNRAIMELVLTLGSYTIASTQTDVWPGWFGDVHIKYRTCGVEWGYDPRYKILVVKEERWGYLEDIFPDVKEEGNEQTRISERYCGSSDAGILSEETKATA